MSCRNISKKKWKTCSWQNQMRLLQPKLPDRKRCKKLEVWSNISSDVLIKVSYIYSYRITVLFWCFAFNFKFLPWSKLPGQVLSCTLPDVYNLNIFMWISSLFSFSVLVDAYSAIFWLVNVYITEYPLISYFFLRNSWFKKMIHNWTVSELQCFFSCLSKHLQSINSRFVWHALG